MTNFDKHVISCGEILNNFLENNRKDFLEKLVEKTFPNKNKCEMEKNDEKK